MRIRLGKVREFFTPRTAVGFLVYGWLGSNLALHLIPFFPGILGMIPVFLLFVPLWVLASKNRAKQEENMKYSVKRTKEEEEVDVS